MDSCDVDDIGDGNGFSGDLDRDELYDCWVANVPSCHVDGFDATFDDLWDFAVDTATELSADATTALEGAIAEANSWHTDSTSGHNHEECPPTIRRLGSFFSSFFN